MFWKKFRKTISNALNSVDKFQEPVQLNLKGNESSTSSLGGLISLVIVIFLGYQFIKQTVDMFQRNSQQVIQMNQFQNDPDSVSLNKEDDFVFGISSRIGGHFYNMSESSLISFKAIYYITYNTLNTSAYQILWAPCNRSNFEIFSDTIYNSYFLAYSYCAVAINYTDIFTGICPNHIQNQYPDCLAPPSFRLQGTAFSPVYESIEVKITLCNPNDTATIYGLKCSPNAYNQTLNSGGINVHVGFTNIYIDPTNYSSPNQPFIDFIDYYLNPLESRIASVYADMETIEDYDNYLLTDQSKKNTFYSISADKMREEQIKPRDYMLLTTIKRSKLNHITTRTYLKIFDVLSNVGGLSEPLFLIGSILILGYARYKYFMIISNELYDFEQYSGRLPPQKVAINSVDRSIHNSSSNQSSALPSPKKLVKLNSKEHFDSLKAKKKLKVSESSYIKGLLMALFKRRSPADQLARKAQKKAIKDLDISKIVNKIKEIDKLKMLLMNENQLEAFKFLKKPEITLKDKKIKLKSPRPLEQENSPEYPNDGSNGITFEIKQEPSKYEKLYMAYKKIKEDKKNENSHFNKKLLSMIDEDIMKMLDDFDNHNSFSTTSRPFEHITQEIQDKSMNINIVDY